MGSGESCSDDNISNFIRTHSSHRSNNSDNNLHQDEVSGSYSPKASSDTTSKHLYFKSVPMDALSVNSTSRKEARAQ